MERKKLPFTGSLDEFVALVRYIEARGYLTNMATGMPATREEVAESLKNVFEVDLGSYPDFKTLDLCANPPDLEERFKKAVEANRGNPDWFMYFASREDNSSSTEY
jgi:hypothetical protein